MVFQSDPYSVLLVSAGEKFNTSMLSLLPSTDYWPVAVAGSIAAARRRMVSTAFDLIIVNAPLADDIGVRFAMQCCAESDAAVLLLIRSELYEETYAKVLPSGVITLSKPTNTQMIAHSLRVLCAMRERLRGMRAHQLTVEEKIEEIRLVNRAKWLLIEREGITESEAHRQILERSMELRISKRSYAEQILQSPPEAE